MMLKALLFVLLSAASSEGSQKKGVCIGPMYYLCGDELAFDKISWWYDWNVHPGYRKGCAEALGPGRVPMVAGVKQADRVLDFPLDAEYVIGFNEPNHKKQGNMSPELAAEKWRELEAAAGDRILVSPSATPCGGTECLTNKAEDWFDAFFDACDGCRVDYLSTHHYPWKCNPDDTMGYLKRLHNRYGLKIWLTEFACPKTTSVEDELVFMKAILPRLEKAPHVARYAWFLSRRLYGKYVTQASNLLSSTNSTLSELGRFYNDFEL